MVIGVVGVLSAGVIMVINPVKQMQRTRDSQRKADLKQIQTGLELYRADVGSYPANLTCDGTLASGGVTYINRVPCDPRSTPAYAYDRKDPNTSAYTIRACLENGDDDDISTDTANLGSCSSGRYLYGVYSP